MADSTRFWRDLAPVHSFEDVAEIQSYTPLPDNWVIVIGDITGSTEAIEAGRYKAVNMVGAAVITAVLNALPGYDVPFVFGGDGAALAVPAAAEPAARGALARLKRHAREMFGLDLKAGCVSAAAVRVVGYDVAVMKVALGGENTLAMFAGGGLSTADYWLGIAQAGDPMLVETSEETARPDLEGLSCRWQPIAPEGGVVLSLIARSADPSPEGERGHVRRVMAGLSDIIGKDVAVAQPVSEAGLGFKWPPAGLDLETRATAGRKWRIRRQTEILTQSLIQYGCEATKGRIGYYDARRYREETIANTDFRKYDDMLRLVLDVTMDQAARIDMFLRAEHGAGRLFYGSHHARAALMTCLVFSLTDSRHVHFIDGSDGGLTLAAVQLKRQLDEAMRGQAAP